MTPKTAGLGTMLTGTDSTRAAPPASAAVILVGSGLINGRGRHEAEQGDDRADRRQREHPTHSSAPCPPGTINQTTFALGSRPARPGERPDARPDLANTGGYLLVTGNMSTDAERFTLAKYLHPDPEGRHAQPDRGRSRRSSVWNGKAQEIPFQVSDTDVSVDVVALCPLPWRSTSG